MAPFVLTLVLTHACNLACRYCYMGEHHRSAMTPAVAERALAMAFARGGPVDVCFFGGEPLLEWDLLLGSAARARALGEAHGVDVRLQMTTNGTLLTRARLASLEALDVHVTLSFDGARAAHESGRPRTSGASSFDAVERAARMLAESAVGLDVIAVVTPENVRWLAESMHHLANLGARRVTMSPSWERPFDDADIAAWEAGLAAVAMQWADSRRANPARPIAMTTFERKVVAASHGGQSAGDRCRVGHRNVAVAPSGNLYPCERLVADDRDCRFVIGNLVTGIDEARVASILRGPSDPECGPCPERFRCGAACACANLAETDETHLPGPTQCWYEQTTARLADDAAHALLSERNDAFLREVYAVPLARRRFLPVTS